MHKNSLRHMRELVDAYLDPAQSLDIADIGSFNYNGSYREMFRPAAWRYHGVDLEPGPNVDVVLSSPYQYPFVDGHFDVIVSGQAFEHVKFFWLTWMEMVRVLKPGGLVFLIAPSRGPEHRYPVDCWRFYPDGFRALAEYGKVECLEAHTDWPAFPGARGRAWGDTVGVFAKPPYRLAARADARQKQRAVEMRRSKLEKAASEVTTMAGSLLMQTARTLLRRPADK